MLKCFIKTTLSIAHLRVACSLFRYQLLKSKNNFPAARLNLEGLGYVKGGKKTVAPPKKVTSERPTSPPKQKFEMTDAEKNRSKNIYFTFRLLLMQRCDKSAMDCG